MYEKLLAKETLSTLLKETGFTDEQLNQEWAKIESAFNILFLKNVFSSLPLEKQNMLEQGLMIGSKLEDLNVFLNRVADYLLTHEKELDYKEIVRNSIKQLYFFYSKL